MRLARRWQRIGQVLLGLMLAGCSSVPLTEPPAEPAPAQPPEQAAPSDAPASSTAATGVVIARPGARWQAVDWADLPGFEADALDEAWNAWLKSCERPGPVFAQLCTQVRQLSLGDEQDKRSWMRQYLQPYRVLAADGARSTGLLTSYFEPELQAQRLPGGRFTVPLYAPPAGLSGQPWFTREQIETLPEAQAALRGRALVYMDDPINALLLQIQGSGRVRVTEPDGSRRELRLAYAGHNGQPYASIGRWLIDQAGLRDASWPGIRAWLQQHPDQVQQVLWRNPRVVFFKQEVLTALDAKFGPRGAQGVALTPGRSIAVDPRSIPYGTPVWLASSGPLAQLQRLVLAQDTGSAIVGAVRADYFAGWGEQAGAFAGRMKQNLQLWVLWPKNAS
jgi:membrane-bound lytic murein transglycosylase A